MSTTQSLTQIEARRAELLAELTLQELAPKFVAQPHDEQLGFDLFIGFDNPRGGINISAVEVKSLRKGNAAAYAVRRSVYEKWAHCNLPVLLLVVDTKHNRVYFAWPQPLAKSDRGELVKLELTEVNEASKPALRARLAA